MCTKWKYVILVSYTLPTYFSWYHNMLPAQGQPCTQLHYFGFLLHHNKANCNLHMNIKVSKIQNRQVIQKEAHMEWTDNIINILLTYWNYHPFVKICGIYNTILKYKIKIIPYIYIYMAVSLLQTDIRMIMGCMNAAFTQQKYLHCNQYV